MARKGLPLKMGAQAVAAKLSQEPGPHQEEVRCQQCLAHGSPKAVELLAGNSLCPVPEKILQTQRRLQFPMPRQFSPPACQLQPLSLSLQLLSQNAPAAPYELLADTARHWEASPQPSLLQPEQLQLSLKLSPQESCSP